MILCPMTKISPKNKRGGSDIESEDQKALFSLEIFKNFIVRSPEHFTAMRAGCTPQVTKT